MPDDFTRIQSDWERRANEEFTILTTDLWATAGKSLGGLPLILFAVISGSLIAGSMMGSGVTAWSLSNGWSRALWIRSILLLNVILTVAAYIILTSGFVLATVIRIAQLGLHTTPGGPGWSAFTPLPGLLFYSLIGLAAGLLTGKGESAVLGALAFITGEYVLSSAMGGLPVFPASLHQVTLDNSEVVTGRIAFIVLLLISLLLATLIWVYFTSSRDVPDRPR
ncbi:MAG: hypothetical protein P1T08_18235 [Acidimicrobiia bacterium]|nr:hypothetical protein [Acidimicrobiia bacterium]